MSNMKPTAASHSRSPTVRLTQRMTTRNKPKPGLEASGTWAWTANANAKRSRLSIPDVAPHYSCVVCRGVSGRLATCGSCNGKYHPRCLDPPINKLPEKGWTCSVCNPPEGRFGATASAAHPTSSARQAASMAHPHSAKLISSVLARLSGDLTAERSVASSCPPIATGAAAPTRRTAAREMRGVSDMTDTVLAWAFGSVHDRDHALESPTTIDGPISPSPLKERREMARRRSGDAWRKAPHSSGATPSCGESRCYCGSTDSGRATVRCVSCTSVFHTSCTDPPYHAAKNVPPAGYMCLVCRPRCAVCDARFSPYSSPSTVITCAACDHVFHRGCFYPPVAGPQQGWKCPDCASRAADNRTDGGLGADAREEAAMETGSCAKRRAVGDCVILGHREAPRKAAGAAVPVGHTAGKAKQMACAVCGVAAGKKLNVCGSCGDAYHSLCLDRPRTRRVGDSWRCDSCRTPTSAVENAPAAISARSPPSATARPLAAACTPPPRVATTWAAAGPFIALTEAVTDGNTSEYDGASKPMACNGKDGELVCLPGMETIGKWTKDEHARFLEVSAT